MLKHVLVALVTIGTIVGTSHATSWVDTFDTVNVSESQTSGAWYVDRYPAAFESTDFDGDNRLSIRIEPPDQDNSFYNYQGRKYDINLSNSVQSVFIDLYVDANMLTRSVNTGLWATGFDREGDVSAYPIIVFRNTGNATDGFVPTFSMFDYYNGGWIFPTSATAGWHTIGFTLEVGTGVEYFVDGTSVGTFADSDTRSLGNVILNTYNFNEEQTYYYDNLSVSSVPEPLTMLAFGSAVAGLGGYIRRRRRA